MKVVKRMMQSGTEGFEGGINARKYMRITGTSKATATRDLQELVGIKVIKRIGKGRNVQYELVL